MDKTPLWAKKLCEKGIDLTKIRSKPFRRIASIIGTANTLDLFFAMHGDFIQVGCEYVRDLEREFCRKFASEGFTEREIASELRCSPAQVNKYMNETPTIYSLAIPMFPESKDN